MNKIVIEIHGETATQYVKTIQGKRSSIEDAPLYVVGWDLKDAGKADEIRAAITKACAEKTTIVLTYGEDMTDQRLAEGKSYDKSHDAVVRAMNY